MSSQANNHQQSDVVPTSHSSHFFNSRSFWTGSLLWLAVLVVIGVAWLRPKPDRFKPVDANNATANAATDDADSEKPKAMVLKHDKFGNVSLQEASETDKGWDPDGIADFSFTNTEGHAVTKADLLGKPWIVCFVFTHCALTCPTVTNSMRELQDSLKECDFRMVTLTVDPERDTPQVLRGYGERFGADFSKWSFLGGNQRDIYQLIQGSFKMPVKELEGERRQVGFEFIHSNNIMLVDQTGVVRGKFDATKGPDMSALKREIRKMTKPVSDTETVIDDSPKSGSTE